MKQVLDAKMMTVGEQKSTMAQAVAQAAKQELLTAQKYVAQTLGCYLICANNLMPMDVKTATRIHSDFSCLLKYSKAEWCVCSRVAPAGQPREHWGRALQRR